jgi:SAM-dependent methyltransferase
MTGAELVKSVKKPLRRFRSLAEDVPLYWGKGRYCPVCGKTSRRFGKYGVIPRGDARCVWCGALERHRFTWLYLAQRTDLFDGRQKRLLHLAAEPAFEERLRQRFGAGYVTVDRFDPRAMVRMDVADVCFPDETFDAIYCSHVLECVPDDRRAIRELCRALRRNGWAVVLAAITGERTVEDPAVTEPADRTRIFGNPYCVRRYGADFPERLADAGFRVRVIDPAELLDERERVRLGINRHAGEIFFCTRK